MLWIFMGSYQIFQNVFSSLMLQPYTYLFVIFGATIICFIASFHRHLQFNKQFKSFLKASCIVALPFIIWDIWFTENGVWWFNTNYTIGLIIAGLPIEEWLFFFCIPFSCLFTYFCLDRFFDLRWTNSFSQIIVFIVVILCSVLALLHHAKTYTFVTTVATLVGIVYLHFIAKQEWIGQASFTYIILSPGFFIVNGILTGTGLASPIVNYNPNEFLGIRMLTIPVEDAIYGYTQFLFVVYFFKQFEQKKIKTNIS